MSQRTSGARRKPVSRASRPFFETQAAQPASFFASPIETKPSVHRDVPKPGSPADRLQKAKYALKAKYGLRNVSEMNGASWTERELKKLDGLFAKMSKEEKERLKTVTLVRTDKFPSKRLKGKTFTIAGTSYDSGRMELTAIGVSDTALHESGHVMHNTAVANAELLFDQSQIKADLDTARNALNRLPSRYIVPADHPQLAEKLDIVMNAARAFQLSSDGERASNRQALEEAEMLLPEIRPGAATKDTSARVDSVRAYVAALLRWSDEREKVVGPIKRLDEFVSIVNKHRLARRSAIFTPYAEGNWPDKPVEFFSEAFKVWTGNHAVVKQISPELAAWFEKGGHLGPKIPPPRAAIRIPIPTAIPTLSKDAPVIEELLIEVGQTFLPGIEGGANTVDLLFPLPLPRDTPERKTP